MISPDSSPGRYFCFCASVPNSMIGTIVRLACAPKVAPNDADRAIFSLTTSEVTLSRPTPPYASGTSTPSRPEVAAALDELARQRPVLLLELVELRQHFRIDELLCGLADQPVFVR